MPTNPFDDAPVSRPKVNPFGEDAAEGDAAARIEHAARKIRSLRAQLGAEGLTLAATRELIDELSAALDAAARALRGK
jgi:flagellin-like hook-associated protein FlgL